MKPDGSLPRRLQASGQPPSSRSGLLLACELARSRRHRTPGLDLQVLYLVHREAQRALISLSPAAHHRLPSPTSFLVQQLVLGPIRSAAACGMRRRTGAWGRRARRLPGRRPSSGRRVGGAGEVERGEQDAESHPVKMADEAHEMAPTTGGAGALQGRPHSRSRSEWP